MMEEMHAKWKNDFQLIADVNGYINISELEVYWQNGNLNPTQNDITELTSQVMESADTDGDGKISLDEFIKFQEAAQKEHFYTADKEKTLIESLKQFDTDGDGTISKEELKGILAGYDGEDLDMLIAGADTNNDGKLSIEELAKYLVPPEMPDTMCAEQQTT